MTTFIDNKGHATDVSINAFSSNYKIFYTQTKYKNRY